MGSHILNKWSTTQQVIAMSSGEAEYYAMVKAASQALGLRALLADLGIKPPKAKMGIVVKTDATAAQGIAARRGLGQVRHIEVAQLWLQQKVTKGEIIVEKVLGTKNTADALTKYVDGETLNRHMQEASLEVQEGRHVLAPATGDQEDEAPSDEEKNIIGIIEREMSKPNLHVCASPWHKWEDRLQVPVKDENSPPRERTQGTQRRSQTSRPKKSSKKPRDTATRETTMESSSKDDRPTMGPAPWDKAVARTEVASDRDSQSPCLKGRGSHMGRGTARDLGTKLMLAAWSLMTRGTGTEEAIERKNEGIGEGLNNPKARGTCLRDR